MIVSLCSQRGWQLVVFLSISWGTWGPKWADWLWGCVTDTTFLFRLLANYKMPEIETWHASAVWYGDDAGTFFIWTNWYEIDKNQYRNSCDQHSLSERYWPALWQTHWRWVHLFPTWGILSIINTCNHVLCCVSQGYVICKTSTTVQQLLHIWLWYLWQTKLSPFFCFVTNLVRYLHTKNYPNKTWFDNLIAKMELCNFFPGGVITSIICYAAFCVPCTDDMWLRETLPGKSDQHPGIKWLLWLHW